MAAVDLGYKAQQTRSIWYTDNDEPLNAAEMVAVEAFLDRRLLSAREIGVALCPGHYAYII